MYPPNRKYKFVQESYGKLIIAHNGYHYAIEPEMLSKILSLHDLDIVKSKRQKYPRLVLKPDDEFLADIG